MLNSLRGRGILAICLGLVFSASMVATTAIAQKDTTQGGMSKQKSETVTVKGKVTAVTDSSLTIVDENKAEATIALDGTTKITKSGKDATIADVKADDSVVVTAKKGDGGALIAVKIMVA